MEFEDLSADDIEQIHDFGCSIEPSNDYDEKPEFFVIEDKEGNIHVKRGASFGKDWETYITYEKDNPTDDCPEITRIYTLKLVHTFKVIGIIEKVNLPGTWL